MNRWLVLVLTATELIVGTPAVTFASDQCVGAKMGAMSRLLKAATNCAITALEQDSIEAAKACVAEVRAKRFERAALKAEAKYVCRRTGDADAVIEGAEDGFAELIDVVTPGGTISACSIELLGAAGTLAAKVAQCDAKAMRRRRSDDGTSVVEKQLACRAAARARYSAKVSCSAAEAVSLSAAHGIVAKALRKLTSRDMACAGTCITSGAYCENLNCGNAVCQLPDALESLTLCGLPVFDPSCGPGSCDVDGSYCGHSSPTCLRTCLDPASTQSSVMCSGVLQSGCGVGACLPGPGGEPTYCDECVCYFPSSPVSQLLCSARGATEYFDAPELCDICPALGSWDGSACLVATAPSGTTPFIYAGGLYVTPLPGNSCSIGVFDLTNCYLGPIPAGEEAYVFEDKLYLRPRCCPCPFRGRFDGANCLVANPPPDSHPFISQDQFYYEPQAGGSCPIGTFDGTHCRLGDNPPPATPFVFEDRFYLASMCVHNEPEPAYFANQSPVLPPPVGELCAPGFWFDGAHCLLGQAPDGTTAFIYDWRFYHTPIPNMPLPPPWQSGSACPAPAIYDLANCERHFVPDTYTPFIYQNKWYTDHNRLLFFQSTTCPAGFTYDDANCLFGTAPPGRTAAIVSGSFVFNKLPNQTCSTVYPGSTSLQTVWCKAGSIPAGHQGFVDANRWYVTPTAGAPGRWHEQLFGPETPSWLKQPACLTDDTTRSWHLVWSDEFEPKPDGENCYTSNDRIWCVTLVDQYHEPCWDSPTDWTTTGRTGWTAEQHERYDGVVHLDKCHWEVLDTYNSVWGLNEYSTSFSPDNVAVEGGVLNLRNYARFGEGPFNCGILGGTPPNYSKECAYRAAYLASGTWWGTVLSHSPTHADPTKRYVGRVMGSGSRLVFRARVTSLGHGALPALWLFGDSLPPGSTETHGGELDVLEYHADQIDYPPGKDPLSTERLTYGIAAQTAHDYYALPTPDTHSATSGLPISIGEWHVYAVEWDNLEVRFYVDGCLRNRLHDGQVLKDYWGNMSTFHIPTDLLYKIFMNTSTLMNVSTWPPWQPWYKASLTTSGDPRPDFKPTEMQVDYVRQYVRLEE